MLWDGVASGGKTLAATVSATVADVTPISANHRLRRRSFWEDR
jgi:hypothetical protein